MTLLVLAYPDLQNSDLEKIQDYRKIHDREYFDVVMPHFSLVFPTREFEAGRFQAEVQKQSEGIKSFSFVLRSATVNKDSFSESYNTFLVTDEGTSRIILLHDRLYSGELKNERRLDIDYIPHISIGSTTNPEECREMAEAWNRSGFEIHGEINALDICRFVHGKVETITRIGLMSS
jgi:hypothetical protein